MIRYEKYNEKSFALRVNKDYLTKSDIKFLAARWNGRMKGGEGYLIPLDKEKELKKIQRRIKKESKENQINKDLEQTQSDLPNSNETTPKVENVDNLLKNYLTTTNSSKLEDETSDNENDELSEKNNISGAAEENLEQEGGEAEENLEQEGDTAGENLEQEDDTAGENLEQEGGAVEENLEQEGGAVEENLEQKNKDEAEVDEYEIEQEMDDEVPLNNSGTGEDVNQTIYNSDSDDETKGTYEGSNYDSDNDTRDTDNDVRDSDNETRDSDNETRDSDNETRDSDNETRDSDNETKDSQIPIDKESDSKSHNLNDAEADEIENILEDEMSSDADSEEIEDFVNKLLSDVQPEIKDPLKRKKMQRSRERFSRVKKSSEHKKKSKRHINREKASFKDKILNTEKAQDKISNNQTLKFFNSFALPYDDLKSSSDSDSCSDSSGFPSPSTVKLKNKEERIIDLERKIVELELENQKLSKHLNKYI